MAFQLTQPYPRLWSLEQGVVMVVTDLHGDWQAYQRYRDHFIELHGRGLADGLIFTGDLIHAEEGSYDHSVEIVLDVLALRATYGAALIYLCGNHELPHLYSISLAKGDRIYTPAFEQALNQSGRRDEVIALFDALPFYLRSRAGVSLTHAGAPPAIVTTKNALKLFRWHHQELLTWAEALMAQEDIVSLRRGYAKLSEGIPYDTLARDYLAVSGPTDPRYDHILRGFIASSHPEFEGLLWPALFTRNEEEYDLADHKIFLDALLQALAENYVPQRILVTGHMTLKGGYKVVTNNHLRLASAYHARPRQAAQYLLFDAAQPIQSMQDLLNKLGSIYA